jgi:LPS-assembly lipoprotein
MLSSRRGFLLGALALGGCGFTPVYGPDGSASALRGTLRVAEPDTRDAFAFVEQMEARLGRASDPQFDLAYTITTNETGLAITGANDVTRFNIEGTLRYVVTPAGSKNPVATGMVRSFTAYTAGTSTISTLTSERDARRRLMVILANQTVTRLLVDPALQ